MKTAQKIVRQLYFGLGTLFEQTCQMYEGVFFQHLLQPMYYVSGLQLVLNLCFLEYLWGW